MSYRYQAVFPFLEDNVNREIHLDKKTLCGVKTSRNIITAVPINISCKKCREYYNKLKKRGFKKMMSNIRNNHK